MASMASHCSLLLCHDGERTELWEMPCGLPIPRRNLVPGSDTAHDPFLWPSGLSCILDRAGQSPGQAAV